jgi:L-fucose isomerase-like protein
VSGRVNPGPVTVFKVSADLSRCFVEEGTLIGCEHKADLCRTQMRIQLQDADRANYFLTNPIGNHHIILKGHHKALLTAFMNRIS